MSGCPVCPGTLHTRRYDFPDQWPTAYLQCPVCGWEAAIPFRDVEAAA